MPNEEDRGEFWKGVWWVPDDRGGWRTATGSECCAEIRRLRSENAELTDKLDKLEGRMDDALMIEWERDEC